MPFKFNPFTGTLDLVNSSESLNRSFNIYYIPISQTVEIQDGDENLVTGSQTIDGTLIVSGRNTIL